MSAVERVTEYLRQLKKTTGLDPQVIHYVHTDPDAPAAGLLIADLEELVRLARRGKRGNRVGLGTSMVD